MFTIGDIKNIAIQIEKNGEESYRNAAKLAKNRRVEEILLWMAEQEKRHAAWFASNLDTSKPLTAEQREMETLGKTLLQDIVKSSSFLTNEQQLEAADTAKEVVDISIALEQETILFYNFLRGFIDDEETLGQLDKIIAEEQLHITKLEEVATLKKQECDEQPH
ncbi:ferritin family protein [Desulforhopalus singaporensis]|uniref:Rubrerythrin n=1 Tax=Desulforhopalus singaporensis TaxID=91360 RepID=A0A1H0LA20_9BACT|nr:ferritin family protein [Desulforhopalus singaporensis]SDO65057.1 Rubrerythrin [Desulforhopalus singaporensis]